MNPTAALSNEIIDEEPNPFHRGDWTKAQDQALRLAVDKFGAKNWKIVAAEIPGGKTHHQCLQRWSKVVKPGIVKGPWRPHEDELLRGCLDLINKNNWSEVSKFVPGRTSKQCRERWTVCLDPSINRAKWTEEEDRLLMDLQAQHGNSWVLISKSFCGRTENAVKTRAKSLLKQREEEEDRVKRFKESPTINAEEKAAAEERYIQEQVNIHRVDMENLRHRQQQALPSIRFPYLAPLPPVFHPSFYYPAPSPMLFQPLPPPLPPHVQLQGNNNVFNFFSPVVPPPPVFNPNFTSSSTFYKLH
jgi:hypothetical protein